VRDRTSAGQAGRICVSRTSEPRSASSSTDQALRSFAGFLLERAPDVTTVNQVTRRHIEDYKPWIAARPGQNRARVSTATLVHRLGTLRMFFVSVMARSSGRIWLRSRWALICAEVAQLMVVAQDVSNATKTALLVEMVAAVAEGPSGARPRSIHWQCPATGQRRHGGGG